MQSLKQVLAYMDGELACRVRELERPREVREASGLSSSEMADRLGMNLDAYVTREGELVEVVDEVRFRRPPRTKSLSERLRELVGAVWSPNLPAIQPSIYARHSFITVGGRSR